MKDVWETGRGSVRLRARWYEEESSTGNPVIIITEIPYQVNKEKLEEFLETHDKVVVAENHLKKGLLKSINHSSLFNKHILCS